MVTQTDEVILEARLQDDMSEQAEKIAKALKRASDAGDGLLATNDDLEKSQRGVESSFKRLERSLDPLVRVQEKYERDLKRIRAAEETGVVGAEKLARARELLEQRFQKESRAADRVAQDYERLKRTIDPLAGATQRLEREQETLNAALRRGIITQDEYEDQLRRVRKGYDDYIRKTKQADQATGGFTKSLGGLKGIAVGAASGLVAGFSFGEIISGARDAAKELDDLAKKARGLGGIDSAEFLQTATFALGQLGIDAEQAEKGLATLDKRVGELSRGFGALVQPLERFAPDIIDPLLAAEGVEERFKIILDALNDIDDAGQRAALASAAFDTALGKALGALGETDVEGFEELEQQARDLGLILDEDILVKAEELTDRFSIASQAIDTQMKPSLLGAFEVIVRMTEGLAQIIRDIKGLNEISDLERETFREFSSPETSSERDRLQQQLGSARELVTALESQISEQERKVSELSRRAQSNGAFAALSVQQNRLRSLNEELDSAKIQVNVLSGAIQTFDPLLADFVASSGKSLEELNEVSESELDRLVTNWENGASSISGATDDLREAFDFSDIKSEIGQLDQLLSAALQGDAQLAQAEQRLEIENEIEKLAEQAERRKQRFDESEARKLIEARKARESELQIVEEILQIEERVRRARQDEEISGLIGREREIAVERLEIEEQIAELKRQSAISGIQFDEDRARAALEEEQRLRRQEEFNDRLNGSIEGAVDNFVDALLTDGIGAFETLANDAKDLFKDFFLDPILQSFNDGFSGVLKSIFSGEGFSITGSDGIFNSLGESFENLENGLTKTFENFGLGKGASSFLGQAGAGAVGGFAGFGIGSALGSSVRPEANSKNQAIGGSIGGGIGLVVGGPVGALIGSTLGSFVGSLFGKASGDQAGVNVGLENFNTVGSFAKNNNAENIRDRDQILSDTQSAIEQIRQFTEASFSNAAFLQVQTSSRDNEGIQVSAGPFSERFERGDVEGATRGAINQSLQLLGGAGDGDVVSRFINALARVDEPFEDILAGAQQLDAVLSAGEEPLSAYAQRLQDTQDAIQPLIDKFKELGLSTIELDRALDDAIQVIRDDFVDALDADIDQFTDPLVAQAKDIAETQIQIFKDAQLLGIDTEKVFERNTLEWQRFLEQAAQTPEAFASISEAIDQIIDQADELGVSEDQLRGFATDAFSGAGDAFRTSLESEILGFTNAPLAQLQTLLENQKSLVETAQQFAEINPQRFGDLAAVTQQRNALELQEFINSLSDEDKLRLGDFIGIVEDYGARISAVTFQLTDALDSATNEFETTLTSLEDTLRDAASAAETLRDAEQAILDQRFPGSGQEFIDDLNARILEAEQRLLSGDSSAADDIASLAQRSADAGFEQFGSSTRAFDNQQFVLDVLRRSANFQENLAVGAQSEIDVLKADFEINRQILDVLQSSSDGTDFLESILEEDRLSNGLIKDMVEELVALRNLQEAQTLNLNNAAGAVSIADIVNAPANQTVINQDDVVLAVGTLDETVGTGNAQISTDLQALLAEIQALRTDQDRQNEELKSLLQTDQVNSQVQAP